MLLLLLLFLLFFFSYTAYSDILVGLRCSVLLLTKVQSPLHTL